LVDSPRSTLADAIVTVEDDALVLWSHRMWKAAWLRLEPSGAAGFPAMPAFVNAARELVHPSASTTHVVWTTGGSLLPDVEFARVLERGERITAAAPT
jgi:D-serine dehydratase